MKKALSILTLLLLCNSLAWSQKAGDNGFLPVFILEQKALLPEEVKETSGLFMHNGRLWTHNDSGGKPILYGLDTTTFEVVQKITFSNVKNKDWEDVCIDAENVYVGDFGNNKGARKDLRILFFPLSLIPTEGNATIAVDSICFRFSDQTDFKKRKVHDFDCEAMFATDEYLYLLSKGWESGTTRLYRLPKKHGKQVAEVVNGFDSQGQISGADYDRNNNILVIVGYVKSIWKPFIYIIYDFDEAGINLANHRFEMPQWTGSQIEGICFFDDGRCFVSSEAPKNFSARVFVADFRKWIAENRKKTHK